MPSREPCPCPGCKGHLRVRTSRRVSGNMYAQWRECNTCDHDAGKRVVPAGNVYPRSGAMPQND